jgi:glycosyltransferase involved in cell wall biosynthesis
MRIAMLVPGIGPYDAVSNDAVGMTDALRLLGHEVALFAPQCSVAGVSVEPPAAIEQWLGGPDDVVIYHYCIGWDFPLALLARVRAKRVVRYHNITPPEFFVDYSPGYVAACAEGRGQIARYARMNCELYLGDSPFNLEDFLAEGVDPARTAVLPPFHKVDELLAVEPESAAIPAAQGTSLLMVGRIAPNKNDFALVESLAVCRQTIDPATRLVRIGRLDPTLATYGDALDRRIGELGVGEAIVSVSDASPGALRAAYESADAFVMLSAHEGFCVPLIEAMALGAPIVAYGSSAIGWTLGDAGIAWDSADAHLVAASIARLRDDAELRATLRERGIARYRATFAPAALQRTLHAAMQRLERM